MNLRMTLGQRVLQYFANSSFLGDARRMELYPPFFLMRIKVLEISEHWREFDAASHPLTAVGLIL